MTLGYGFENNTAVYVDGFYQPDMVTINGDLANLASVQVLKGPQGTLNGRNSTGGLVSIITNRPTKESGGFGSVDPYDVLGHRVPVSERKPRVFGAAP